MSHALLPSHPFADNTTTILATPAGSRDYNYSGEGLIKQSYKGKDKVEYAMDASGSGSEEATEMEIEESESCTPGSPNPRSSSHSSLPDILHRVLLVEYEKVKERQAVLVLAIHAVMLETGFVLNQPMGAVGSSDGCGLPPGWSGKGSLVNLSYTLPEIIRASTSSGGVQSNSHSIVGDALLRCQVVGNALVVYGCVTGANGSEIYRLGLPVSRHLHKDLVVEDNGNAGDALKVCMYCKVNHTVDSTSSSLHNIIQF